MTSPKNRAVILDRDGVINVDKGYVHTMADFELLPRVTEALKLLPRDFKLIIITNQSGIGRGFYTQNQFLEFMDAVKDLLSKKGIRLDRVYHCPHLPWDNCRCRKPATSLLKQAAREFNLDLKRCFVVGDQTSDIKMGQDGGCYSILVQTGSGGEDRKYPIRPEYVARDLYDAIRHIVEEQNESA